MTPPPADVRPVRWGKTDLHPRYSTDHFLVVGATGSGKTLLIKALMKSVLHPNSIGVGSRALVYDPKQEFLPALYGLGLPRDAIKVLHPFDDRGSAWRIADDVTSPIVARQIAAILVPRDEHARESLFFSEAARELLMGVMVVLMRCTPNPGRWTFRDLILGTLYDGYLRYLLSMDTDRDGRELLITRRLRTSYLSGHQETIFNIRASLSSRIGVYEPIAAAWDQAGSQGRWFSISEWAACSQILVMGNDETARASIDPINRALFQRMGEVLVSGPEVHTDEVAQGMKRSWVILDEVREAGELEGLSRLMTKGRSKGACVVLGFQDIEGLRSVYGGDIANEIVGQCTNLVFLRMNSAESAEWASRQFGDYLAEEENRSLALSFGHGDDEAGRASVEAGRSVQLQKRENVLSSELLYLQRASRRDGISGFRRFSGFNPANPTHTTRFHMKWDADIADHLPHEVTGQPCDAPFVGTLARSQYLRPWDEEDWRRLGFDGAPPSPLAASQGEQNTPPPKGEGNGGLLRTMTGI